MTYPTTKQTLLFTTLLLLTLFLQALTLSPLSSPLLHPRSRCTHLIKPSLSATFDWTSPAALSLAFCLQSTVPQTSTCLFYTSSARTNATAYARATGNITIYDVYSPWYFDTSHLPAKRWKELGRERAMWRITSKAYAMRCAGEVGLVLPYDVGDEDVCRNSIWVTDEWEVIRGSEGKVSLPVWRISWVPHTDGGDEDDLTWERRALRGASDSMNPETTRLRDSSLRKLRRREQRARGAGGGFQNVLVIDDNRNTPTHPDDGFGQKWEDADDPWAVIEHGKCGPI